MDTASHVETYNVLFTRKVSQKQRKGWMDGVATITYNDNGQVTCSVVDEEGTSVTKGRIPSDKLPVEPDIEFVVSSVLVQVNEKIDSTEVKSNTAALPLRRNNLAIQRPGLRRTVGVGFKPPKRIAPVIHQPPPPPSPPSPPPSNFRESSSFEKSSSNSNLSKYRVDHFRGQFPNNPIGVNDEPHSPPRVNKPSRKERVENHTISKRERVRAKPRTFDEILKFFGEGEIVKKEPKIDDFKEVISEKKDHTPAHVILASFQAGSSDDDDNDMECTPPPPPSWSKSDESSNDSLVSDNDDDVECIEKEPVVSKEPEEQKEFTASNLKIPFIWGPQKIGAAPFIPTTFKTYDEYRDSFVNSIIFELNYKIKEVYRTFEAAVFSTSRQAPKCPKNKSHGPCKFIVDRKGNYCYICTKNGCSGFIPVSGDVEIPQQYNKSMAASYLRSKGIPAAEATLIRNSKNVILNTGKSAPDGEFSKDDIWLIIYGTQHVFSCSDGYGMSSGSKVFLEPFFSDLNVLPMNCKVLAIRLFNASSEKSAILKLYNTPNLPIMPALLNGSPVEPIKVINAQALAEETAKEYNLNEKQTEALMRVSEFLSGENPILLIHGIFGAGKSKLLSVITVYLDRVLSLSNLEDKILISATTNVAVDNVLNNLLKIDFEDFTRVGSVRKINRDIMPYTTGNSDADSIKELKNLSKQEPNEAFNAALRNAETEKRTKKSRIDTVRVTGVTCAASNFAVMKDREFSFVLLDECSQQPEPISFLPISFGCARLICCGDPMQLPPTISSHAPFGYGRPLFSRLIKTFPPIMLNMQYRCHPAIANICSKLFYGNKVVSGISEEDRKPYPNMATISVFDCNQGKEQVSRGSFENRTEATTVISLVQCLIRKEIPPKEIGVICFYKAQVDAISQRLMNGKRPIVDVSTVDAFQGDERDCIIITTTRTQCSSFVEMSSRVNVAVSRARRHLFIVSNLMSLCNSEIWGTVFSSAKGPNSVFRISDPPPLMWDPFEPENE